MSRPKKQTVDYFPHYCNHKKTMHIIEQRYGNDGYAFWFKLLEMLGETEGHYVDLGDDITREFLQAKTRLSGVLCTEILDLLARLGAIDAELWSKNIIWCQNFVDGIAIVYKNRRLSVPERPAGGGFYRPKPRCAEVSTGQNPQSRVEESRVKNSRGEPPPTPPKGSDVAKKTGKPQSGESLTVGEPPVKTAGMAAGTEAREQSSTTLVEKRFEEFWAAYPRKVGKKVAEVSWKKIRPDAKFHCRIMLAVGAAKASEQWRKEGGRFIPNPATWLNQGRWDDEHVTLRPRPVVPRAYQSLEDWAKEEGDKVDQKRG